MDQYDRLMEHMMLFKLLHSSKTNEEKYQKTSDYLKGGGDVNAVDGLDNDNSLLHIAVMQNNLDLVRKLLDNNANIKIENRDGKNPLEVAKLMVSKENNTEEIKTLLENHFDHFHKYGELSTKNAHKPEKFKYKKRKGTSGIRGQLYETKLTSLVLFRALVDREMTKFYLGTNIDEVGDLDDVCFKYELRNDPTQRMLFIQAKHKDDPNKEKLSLDDLKNMSSIFSLAKYFDSYVRIKNMLKKDNTDPMFRGELNAIDCALVLFTPSKSSIPDKFKILDKTSHQTKNILHIKNKLSSSSSKNKQDEENKNKVFQINDISLVLKSSKTKRIQELGELIKNSILTDNDKKYTNLMSNNLIKKYHVILARKVISVSDIHIREINKSHSEKYRNGYFYADFFNSKDDLLKILRDAIFQDVKPERRDLYKQESFTFKLPHTFGNLDLHVQKPQRIESLARDFIKLFEATYSYEITIDEEMFQQTTNKEGLKLEQGFIKLSGGIAGLIGNLLIVDNETETLKFNNIDNLSNGNAKKLLKFLLQDLKVEEEVLYKYRFIINIADFPTLLLDGDKQERLLAQEFLSKLWFFTNQPTESQIETYLKEEIARKYRLDEKQLLRIQSDAIYLRFHDAVQKWWLKDDTEYLTMDCPYLENSKNITIRTPKLAVLDFVFMNKVKKHKIQFDDETLCTLGVQDFLNEKTKNILNIISTEGFLTIIKLSQYFNNNSIADVTFLDVSYIIDEDYCDIVETEIENTMTSALTKVLIFNHKRLTDADKLCNIIESVRRNSKIKLIIVSETNISSKIELHCDEKCITETDKTVYLDDILNVSNLSQNWMVNFQGQETKFNDVVDERSKKFIHSKMLWSLINDECIEIGKPIETSTYDEVKKYCIPRILVREEEFSIHNFTDIDETLVIVSAEPGMGKSILLSQLALKLKQEERNMPHQSTWVVHINLLDYSGEFRRWQREKINIDANEAIRFICKAAIHGLQMVDSKQKNNKGKSGELNAFKITVENKKITSKSFIKDKIISFQLELFLYYYQNGSVIFLLDGFDEICPHYEKEVLCLLKMLTINYHAANCDFLMPVSMMQNAMNLLSPTPFQCNCQQLDLQRPRLWVTTRSYSNVKNALEKELGKKTYTLKPLSREEQAVYLKQFMEINFNLLTLTKDEIKNISGFFDYMLHILSDENRHIKMVNVPLYTTYLAAVDYFHNHISTYSTFEEVDKEDLRTKCATTALVAESYRLIFETQYNVNQLMSISENPLYLYIAAEYFLDQIKDVMIMPLNEEEIYSKWDVNTKSFSLFEHFLDIKFRKIRFGEKKKIDLDNPDNEMSFKKERKDFIDTHKRLALFALYEEKDLLNSKIFSKDDLKLIHSTIEKIDSGEEKTGVIEKIVDNTPRFVHMVFAEYFAVEYICEKLKTAFLTENDSLLTLEYKKSLWEFVLNSILYNNASGARTFFDRKLKEDSDFLNIISCQESKKIVFEEFLKQGKNNRVNPEGFSSNFQILKTSLNIATEESLFNIQDYILACAKDNVDASNLAEFTEIIANSLTMITAFAMNNDNLMEKIHDCISPLGNTRNNILISLLIPTFVKDIIPFEITGENALSIFSRLTSSIGYLSQLTNLNFTDITCTSSLRTVIIDYLKLLWDLLTSD